MEEDTWRRTHVVAFCVTSVFLALIIMCVSV
jgi:hypothetical protein